MVELETESDDEDIIDVDKKTIEKGEFENNDNQIEGSKSKSLSTSFIKMLLCWRHNLLAKWRSSFSVGTGVTNNHFCCSTLLVKVVFHYYWSDYGGIRTLCIINHDSFIQPCQF